MLTSEQAEAVRRFVLGIPIDTKTPAHTESDLVKNADKDGGKL